MTPNQLAIATGANLARATKFLPSIKAAMQAYGIDKTKLRQAMFLANVGHESGGLRFLVEIWGPTKTQLRYEGREDLGNIHKGDGYLYRGRGFFQITGLFNYVRLRDRLRARFPELGVPDFEAEPEKLALPQWAALTAADYVDREGLNAVADSGDFDRYVKKINGGLNGIKERRNLYAAAIEAISS